MPTKSFDFQDFSEATFDPIKVALVNHELRLRKKDTSGEFSRTGTFELAEVVFPEFKATALIDLWALEEFSTIPTDENGDPDGAIDYQFSNDNGTTFYFWGGGSWDVAGPTDFSIIDDVNLNIATFYDLLDSNRSIKIKVRFTPSSDEKKTPILQSLDLHYGLKISFLEDLKRSLKRYIENEIELCLTAATNIQIAGSSFDLETPFTIMSVVSVYNTTIDPAKQINLFDTFTAPKTVTLTSSQAAGEVLEFQYFALPKVVISADPFIEQTEVPSIVINVASSSENRLQRVGHPIYEKNTALLKARKREGYTLETPTIQIFSQSPRDRESLIMANAVDEIFQNNKRVPSLGSGLKMFTTDYTPFLQQDELTGRVMRKMATLGMAGFKYHGDTEEVPLATEIRSNIGLNEDETPEQIINL